MTIASTAFTPIDAGSNDSTFAGKTLSAVAGVLGTVVRVWEDTPHVATVPAVDGEGRKFEFVFADDRKDLFDAFALGLLCEAGLSIEATGFWRKRTWKKTRSAAGGWGHTWQFVAAAWTLSPVNGTPAGFGHVPDTMIDPIAGLPNLPFDIGPEA
jgi:hypothetical protein